MRNTRRKKLPPEAVRSCTITTKITACERKKILDLAARCSLTPSDYMRHRAMGYEPPSALTAEETALLRNLDGYTQLRKCPCRNEERGADPSVPEGIVHA